jgi:hypothetical protein
MSVECQQETHAAQQTALLFDHLGGDKQQLWRDFEVERSTAHNRIKMELHCFLWIGYEGWRIGMKWTSWAFLAFVGSLLFLVLYIKDSEINGGVDRLSHVKAPPHSGTSAEKQAK